MNVKFLMKRYNNIHYINGMDIRYVATINDDCLVDIGSKFKFEPNMFMTYLDSILICNLNDGLNECIRLAAGTMPTFIGPTNDKKKACYVHIGESTFTIGEYNNETKTLHINNCVMPYKDFNLFLYENYEELNNIESRQYEKQSNKILSLMKFIENHYSINIK